MKKRNIIFWVVLLIFGFTSFRAGAQDVRPLVRKGNDLFKKGKFSDAEVQYRKALEKQPKYQKAQFNLGDAIYQEKNFNEAGSVFDNLVKNKGSKKTGLKSNSWYNLGNTLMQQKKYGESIKAYINSLLLNPNDYNAKYNLEYARKKLKKQNQNKNQNKNKNKNNKNKKKNNKNNKKKNNKNKNNHNKNNQNKHNKNQNNKGNSNNQKRPNQPPKISKQEAQHMLNALRNREKNTLKNLEKRKAKAVKTTPNGIGW